MAEGEEPVIIDGQEIATREAALAQVSSDPGFSGLVPSGAPAEAREQVRSYAEKIWQLGKLLDNGGKFVVTPEGIQRAVTICHQGAEHANYAMAQSEQAKGFLSAMFGSCAQGQAYAQTVGEWMDRMGEKATTLQAILNGVADGTQEIKAKAETTDSEWACAFRKVKADIPAPSVGSRAGGSL
ncbi:hypothetical protein [Segniliparus rugosus]|uniref:Uncharacterized protein n=1 Tax=Segniliparus rugosus (strain ATCC BAA-974 / DSM 45345 / CCUG 50838 / CIP 108380 / JCM 13579 / CDC 945) TaxID=679197 RepID=E5XRF0_SEGRC|nr:hypothetical protein [Segniliparus rugosus]EFV13083.1 hypothetical protein HMPREF9336_02072 [Segniliparus rugosus ATCC BAA-974]